jgi:hypothetical protein
VRVDLDAQRSEDFARPPVHGRPVDAPIAPRLAADEDILGYVELGESQGLLVDERDAKR